MYVCVLITINDKCIVIRDCLEIAGETEERSAIEDRELEEA